MKILGIIDLLLGIIIIYFIFIHEHILARKEHKCIRCGKCCRLRVDLSEEEISKIKKLGYKDFYTKNNHMKKINGNCVFLKFKNGISFCEIQNTAKPSICKNFPKKRGLFGKAYDYRCRSFWKLKS
jgi:Fe-S-cluster containining protein